MQFSSDTNMKSTLLYFETVKDKYMDTLEKEIHHIQFFPPHQQTHSLTQKHKTSNTHEVFLEGGRACVQRRVRKLTLTLHE